MRPFLCLPAFLAFGLPLAGRAKDPAATANQNAFTATLVQMGGGGIIDGKDHPFEKACKQVAAGMTEAEVRKIMGSDPSEIIGQDTILWSFRGGRAMGEPPPVCYVYRVYFEKGKVTRTEKTISDCIYQAPRNF